MNTLANNINDSIEEDMIRKKDKLIRSYQKKSRGAGDYWHNKAVQMGAVDDYLPADHGEAPKGA